MPLVQMLDFSYKNGLFRYGGYKILFFYIIDYFLIIRALFNIIPELKAHTKEAHRGQGNFEKLHLTVRVVIHEHRKQHSLHGTFLLTYQALHNKSCISNISWISAFACLEKVALLYHIQCGSFQLLSHVELRTNIKTNLADESRRTVWNIFQAYQLLS